MAKYKAMTHIQLADCAGVSRRILYKWLHPYKDKLRKLGVQPNAKVIPPKAVRFICETFTTSLYLIVNERTMKFLADTEIFF